MAEHVQEIVVAIEVVTNKNTYKRRLVWGEDESREQFEQRVVETIEHLTEVS